MGTIKGKFIKGKAGSLVFREYRGSQVVSGMPKVIKGHRTEGTKKAATLFGKSSKLAGGIRWGLAHVCGKFYDGTMIYRSNAEILRCLTAARNAEGQLDFNADSFRGLAGFEFNIGSTVKNHFYAQPMVTVEGSTLRVTVPQINTPTDLRWPSGRLKACKLLVATTAIDLKRGSTRFAEPQVMDIPYSHAPALVPSQTFEFGMVPGCLHVTAISLQYVEESFIGDTTINTKDFNPAAILHAHLADGTTDPALSMDWYRFDEKGY